MTPNLTAPVVSNVVPEHVHNVGVAVSIVGVIDAATIAVCVRGEREGRVWFECLEVTDKNFSLREEQDATEFYDMRPGKPPKQMRKFLFLGCFEEGKGYGIGSACTNLADMGWPGLSHEDRWRRAFEDFKTERRYRSGDGDDEYAVWVAIDVLDALPLGERVTFLQRAERMLS